MAGALDPAGDILTGLTAHLPDNDNSTVQVHFSKPNILQEENLIKSDAWTSKFMNFRSTLEEFLNRNLTLTLILTAS
jgi:hypothetical protein